MYRPLAHEFRPAKTKAICGMHIYDGVYNERDTLYCEHIPTEKVLDIKRVKEIIIYGDLISVSILNFPYGDHRPWTDARSFEGTYTLELDSRNGNYNIQVDGICKLVINKKAQPKKLEDADIRAMKLMEETLYGSSKEEKDGDYKEAK